MRITSIIAILAICGLLTVPGVASAGIADDIAAGMELPEVARRAFEGSEPKVSSAEAVQQLHAANPELGMPEIVTAVMEAWSGCDDTYQAIMQGVSLQPAMAADIAAGAAIKKDCNCRDGGNWLESWAEQSNRSDVRYTALYMPLNCSCRVDSR